MSETVLIITAICETDGCSQNDVACLYERESEVDFIVSCGQCQNIINHITATPKV
jgi:hypothetical protein